MLSPIRALRGFLGGRGRRAVKRLRRTWLGVEALENRRVLTTASALPGITGTVFSDTNGDGIIDPGEEAASAIVRLYQDDGDGIFEPGTGDAQVGADALTDVNGQYCFDNLDEDEDYFVQQPGQLVGGNNLSALVSPLITIEPDLIIDSFQTTQTTVAFPPPVSNDASALSFPNENEVIGAERDLAVELTSGTSEIQLRVNPFGLQDVLLFDSSAGSQGTRQITWDGLDGNGDNLAFGLGGRDLTQLGTLSGITMRVGVDANGANARLRLYQNNAANFSEVTVPIPVTGGVATQWVFVPFSDFSGPVSETNVDAIQLILDTGGSSVDGQIDVIGVLGARVQNFANAVTIDLEVDKSANVTNVLAGDNVIWTISVNNNAANATAAATNVQVTDVVPSGVSLVSATPSGNGTYNAGVWSLVDPLQPNSVATLNLTTTVNGGQPGGTQIENIAQVSTADQTDIDSVPNNDDGDQSEDDEDSAVIQLVSQIDLELQKSVSASNVIEGDQVTWTLTISNNQTNANTDATGVQVADVLPTGVTFVSATPSIGTYSGNAWTLGSPLAPGASATLAILTTVDINAPSSIQNVAQVSAANETDIDSATGNDDGDQSEDDEANATIQVAPVTIDLELGKTVSASSVNLGDQVTWTVTVTNNAANANSDATGVEITDVLPNNGVTFQSASSSSGTFSGNTWTLGGPLAPGASETLSIVTTVDTNNAGGNVLTNTAEVSATSQTDIDSAPGNDDGDQSEDDEANAQTTVNSVIDLEISKSANNNSVSIGDTVTWTIAIQNDATRATIAATGVTATDVFPIGLTFVSAVATNGSYNNATGNWVLTSALNPGDSATLTVVSTVDAGAAGLSLLNVAEVVSHNEVDIDSLPGNDDGDQSEDDEDAAQLNVAALRPMSKRDLLASS